jgi:hypothetical protein
MKRDLTITHGGEATRDATWATRLGTSASASAEGATLDVTVCAHPLADLTQGFEALIREPHGCFEQQTATLFPMVLALQLLDEIGSADEELRTRGFQHLAAGFEALLRYEVQCEPGGFSLWGHAPADTMLTAFGLMLFRESDHLRPTPPRLIERIEARLLSRRCRSEDDPQALGSWGPDDDRRVARTAFITWALGTGRQLDALRQSWKWLAAQRDRVVDPYELALAALALQGGHTATAPWAARDFVDRLLAIAIEEEGTLRFEPGGATLVGARGNAARAETAALAALALLRDGRHPQAARAAVRSLLGYREAWGRFQTTHATVFALMALCATKPESETEPAVVSVRLDGAEIARSTIPVESPRALRIVTAHPLSARGSLLEVATTGTRPLRATATITTPVPWDAAPLPHGPLALEVRWPRKPLTLGEQHTLHASVTNRSAETVGCVTVEIGLPPACEVDAAPDRDPRIQDVERLPHACVVYLGDLAPGEQVSCDLLIRPDRAFDATTTPSRAWPYYAPDQLTLLAPTRVAAESR